MSKMWQCLKDVRVRTTAVIDLTAIFERADEAILPSMIDKIAGEFHAGTADISKLATARGFVQALTSPVGGVLGNFNDRINIIIIGCMIWGLMTAIFGVLSSFVLAGIVWGVNGFGQSLVIPNTQSVIADYYSSNSRGIAFGTLYATGAVGGILGTLYSTNVGGEDNVGFGVAGWRFVMFSFAAFSVITGMLNFFFARDPRRVSTDTDSGPYKLKKTGPESEFSYNVSQDKAHSHSIRHILHLFGSVLKIPTFAIVILQGIVGSMPYKALAIFFVLYFKLIGMSNFEASVVNSMFLTGTALGALFGGWIGDLAGYYFPNHGRVFACQFSVFSGIPLSVVVFKGMPTNGDGSTVVGYAFLCFVYGLLLSWAAPACNNPIFAEIVPPDRRNIIYSFDRCLEDGIASFANYMVGYIASDWFGFKGEARPSGNADTDQHNATAIANAMLFMCIVPWSLCLLLYSGLHWTYPRDRDRVLAGYSEVPTVPLADLHQ